MMYDLMLKKQLSMEETDFIISTDFVLSHVRSETEERVEHQGNGFITDNLYSV